MLPLDPEFYNDFYFYTDKWSLWVVIPLLKVLPFSIFSYRSLISGKTLSFQ